MLVDVRLVRKTSLKIGSCGWRLKFNTELRFLNRKLDPGKEWKKIHPGSLTYPLKNDGWKTTSLLGWYIFRGYVKLPGCTCNKAYQKLSPESRKMFFPVVFFLCSHLFLGKKPSSTNDKRRVPSAPPYEHIIIVALWVENIQATPAVGTRIASDNDGSGVQKSG